MTKAQATIEIQAITCLEGVVRRLEAENAAVEMAVLAAGTTVCDCCSWEPEAINARNEIIAAFEKALAILRAASAVYHAREPACPECGLVGEHKLQCGRGGYSRVFANIEGDGNAD